MARNSYRYSFSGADAKASAFFSNMEEDIVHLESIHTVSVSVHEAKGQARALGHRGIKGHARGVRTIAGSMIFTIIEDHPLRPLLEQYSRARELGWNGGWSVDQDVVGTGSAFNIREFNNRLPTLLPPFNMIVQYVTETAEHTGASNDLLRNEKGEWVGWDDVSVNGAAWLIKGIEIIDVGLVTSTNDIVTEMTVSFSAADFKPLTSNKFKADRYFSNTQVGYKKHMELMESLRAGQQSPPIAPDITGFSNDIYKLGD